LRLLILVGLALAAGVFALAFFNGPASAQQTDTNPTPRRHRRKLRPVTPTPIPSATPTSTPIPVPTTTSTPTTVPQPSCYDMVPVSNTAPVRLREDVQGHFARQVGQYPTKRTNQRTRQGAQPAFHTESERHGAVSLVRIQPPCAGGQTV
jgi:hypothetical protein